ncbi:MAG: hypothetical protein QOE14_2328 [Humisphaera sp.]|nr:hypothetical protein [Humisphaera sp.]
MAKTPQAQLGTVRDIDPGELYESVLPTDNIDSRATTCLLASITLLAFSLSLKKPDGIELLGMTFRVDDAHWIGIVLLVTLIYASAQLWIVWWLARRVFAHKYGKSWSAMSGIFVAHEEARRAIFQQASDEVDQRVKDFKTRQGVERGLEESIRPARDRRNAAYEAYGKLNNASTNERDDAEAEIDAANEAEDELCVRRDKVLRDWDEQHPSGGGVSDATLIGEIKSGERDWQTMKRLFDRFDSVYFWFRVRRWLELLVPLICSLVATIFFVQWLRFAYGGG